MNEKWRNFLLQVGENENNSTKEELKNKTKSETTKQDEDKSPRKLYSFSCQKSGQCCQTSLLPVMVTFTDIKLWTTKGALTAVFPHIEIKFEEKKLPQLILQNYDKENNPIEGCPMYDTTNKICKIYHSMPTWCKTFPLVFDGKNYKVSDKSCPGLGKGEMTKDLLINARDDAKQAFNAQVETNLILPTLNALWTKNLLRMQDQALKNLSPEDQQQIENIFSKKQEKPT